MPHLVKNPVFPQYADIYAYNKGEYGKRIRSCAYVNFDNNEYRKNGS